MKASKQIEEIRDITYSLSVVVRNIVKSEEIVEYDLENLEEIGRKILDCVAYLRVVSLF